MIFLRSTFRWHATTILKVAFFVATPFKSLAVYKNYLAVLAQTRPMNTGGQPNQPNRSYLRLFKLLFAFQAYFILLNSAYLTVQSITPNLLPGSSLHILTFDTVHLFHLPSSFYLTYVLQCCFGSYLTFLFYFRPNRLLNGRLEVALYGRQSKQGNVFLSPSVDVATMAAAVKLTNAIEGFILLLDICLLMAFLHFTLVFIEHFQVPETSVNFFCLAAYFVVYLLHALAFIVNLYAFNYIFCLAGAFGFVCLIYLYLFVRLNTEQIRRAVRRQCRGVSVCQNATIQLVKLLRNNITAFQMLFAGNAFFGNSFLAFLLINLPSNALFTMMLLFGRQIDRLSLFAIGIFATHEMLGIVLLHFALAWISRHVHSAGALLMGHSARNGLMVDKGLGDKGDHQQTMTLWKSKVKQSLLKKQKIIIWRHTMRLVTANRYGFTYGMVGACVTMSTFTKV